MKKTLVTVLVALSAFVAQAQQSRVSEPDFAYPKTVLKSADSLYNVAVRNGDAIGRLEAMMQADKASALIDGDTRGASVTRALDAARSQSDRQMKALFDLYAAQLYSDYYRSEMWKFNRRELPASPRPADISEWSGEMFRTVIDSLCSCAWSDAGGMPLSSLTRVIEANRLTQQYFPTLRDFVASAIVSNIGVSQALRHKVEAETLASAVESSARYYYLTGKKMQSEGKNLADFARAFMNASDKYNALVLWQFVGDTQNAEDAGYIRDVMAEAKKVAARSWAEPMVDNAIAEFNQPRLTFSRSNGYVPAGKPAEIKVSGAHNMDTLVLNVLRYTNYDSWRKAGSSGKSVRPVSTEHISFGLKGVGDTTLSVTLPAGYYRLTSDGFTGAVRLISTPVIPVVTSTGYSNIVSVLDAATGRPIAGANIEVINYRNKVTWSGVTAADGRVTIMTEAYGNLRIRYAGASIYFNGTGPSPISKPGTQRPKNLEVSFTTDLGVVNPGDSVRWLAVASGNSGVSGGDRFSIIIANADNKAIDTVRVVTDEFGRASGAFQVPSDSKTGTFSLRAVGSSYGNISGYGSFEVADFKVSGVKLSKLVAVPDNGKVCVSGTITNYSGAGLSGSTIEGRINLSDTTIVAEALSGQDGKFDLAFDVPAGTGWCYVTLTATSPDGNTVKEHVSVDARYRATLSLSTIGSSNIDIPKGLELNAAVVTASGDSLSVPLGWQLLQNEKTVAKGSFTSAAKISVTLPDALAPGRYSLKVVPADSTLCAPQSTELMLYRSNLAQLPVEAAMWSPSDTIIGIGNPGAFVYATYMDAENKCHMVNRELKGGYYDIYKIMDFDNALPGSHIRLFTVNDGIVCTVTVPVRKKKSELNIKIESFRDKVIAGARETWKFHVTSSAGRDVLAALALNVYDLRLQQLRAPMPLRINDGRMNIYGPGLEFARIYLDCYMYKQLSLREVTQVSPPIWKWYDEGGLAFVPGIVRSLGVSRAGASPRMMAKNTAVTEARDFGAVTMDALAVREDENETAEEITPVPASALDDVELRVDDRYSALWAPMLTTGTDGRLDVPFDVPNSNTGWQMTVTVWDKDGKNVSLSRTFTSGKPVTVSLNAPLFVRGGDIVTVLTSVVNTTDAEREVTVRLESSATASMPVVDERVITLGANANTVVPISVGIPALADSVQFVIRAISGDNSDGELVAIPVLTSQSTVTETQNFYLNPGDTSWSASLPAAKGKDYEASLTYTGNPMWTIVSALPEITGEQVFSTAGGQARAYFCSAVALSLMKLHPELGMKFKERDLRRVMDSARKGLGDLQCAGGGWKWGVWSTEPSVYVTGEVLDVMAVLKRNGMLDDKEMERMIRRALPYYDDNVDGTDMLYTIVRSAFSTPAQSLNGQKVMNATVQEINRNWKKFTTGNKALAACALWYTGNTNMARTVLGSLDQFGTQTRDKGFEFKNVRSLHVYAWLLECYGAITPESPIVDGLRQYLIVRKQGEDWGNRVITSNIVASMINSGTPWTVTAGKVTLNIDGTTSVAGQTDKLGQFTVPVRGNDLTLTRAEAVTPAYGALITRYTAPSADIKAYSDGEISIEKRLMVQNADGTWRNFNPAADSLRVGETVKTLLTVKADRPMSRVVVTDERAATLVPVSQLSGWIYGDGLSGYRENRASTTNIYLDYVPKGTWLLEYSFRVNNAGTFNTGVATATCSQAPTLTAHSSGYTLSVAR